MRNSNDNRPPLRWMQIVGAFYVLQFVMMVVVRAPIRTFGPAATLSKAADGDSLARFVVDTWTIFGLAWTLMHGPAVTLPVFTGPSGLPIGLQVTGPRGADAKTLLAAEWIRRALQG
jgi:Asp-tRNA(Asn)/Glu-tRNA(Gln) amidotransferase A subunit family amidase